MSDIERQVIDEAEHEQDDLRDHQTAASSKNTFRTIATLLGLIVVAFWSSWAMSDRGDSEIQDLDYHVDEAVEAIYKRDVPSVVYHRNALRSIHNQNGSQTANVAAELFTAFIFYNANDYLGSNDLVSTFEQLSTELITGGDGLNSDMQIIQKLDMISKCIECLNHMELQRRHRGDAEVLSMLPKMSDLHQILTDVIQTHPECIEAHRILTAMYSDIGDMDGAMRHALQVADLDRTDSAIYRFMGNIHKDYEQWRDALDNYQSSLERSPYQSGQALDRTGREEILFDMAEIQIKLLEFESALETLSKIRDFAQTYALQATCHYNLGAKAKAANLVAVALSADNSLKPALMLQGSILVENSQFEEAISLLERGKELDPYDFELIYKLGEAHRGNKDNDAAEACFEESSQLREKREAFADLHQLAIEEPGNSGTLVQLGKVAAELGKYKLARHWCTSALQIDSGNIEAQQTLAQIQQQMQQQSLSPDSSTDAVTPN
jgi:tetratricopeptide (TPR) repeat protein